MNGLDYRLEGLFGNTESVLRRLGEAVVQEKAIKDLEKLQRRYNTALRNCRTRAQIEMVELRYQGRLDRLRARYIQEPAPDEGQDHEPQQQGGIGQFWERYRGLALGLVGAAAVASFATYLATRQPDIKYSNGTLANKEFTIKGDGTVAKLRNLFNRTVENGYVDVGDVFVDSNSNCRQDRGEEAFKIRIEGISSQALDISNESLNSFKRFMILPLSESPPYASALTKSGDTFIIGADRVKFVDKDNICR